MSAPAFDEHIDTVFSFDPSRNHLASYARAFTGKATMKNKEN
jgi:hypothetical protein